MNRIVTVNPLGEPRPSVSHTRSQPSPTRLGGERPTPRLADAITACVDAEGPKIHHDLLVRRMADASGYQRADTASSMRASHSAGAGDGSGKSARFSGRQEH